MERAQHGKSPPLSDTDLFKADNVLFIFDCSDCSCVHVLICSALVRKCDS